MKLSPYQRAALRLMRGKPKPKPFGKLIDGKFFTGTKSLHRTKQGRAWNTFWRIKLHVAWYNGVEK
jgi:hypothetical protein